MQPTPARPSRTFIRRYGPLIAIVAALAVVAGVVVATHGNSPSTKSAKPVAARGNNSAAVISWSKAKAEGKTKSIDWGSRCNTATGTLKFPDYFAGECYAPFTGDNGGATYQGVTAHAIKVVLYLAEPNDPILSYIEGSIADTDTNQQTIETVDGYIKFCRPTSRPTAARWTWCPSWRPAPPPTTWQPAPTPSPSPDHQALRRLGRPYPHHGVRRRDRR